MNDQDAAIGCELPVRSRSNLRRAVNACLILSAVWAYHAPANGLPSNTN